MLTLGQLAHKASQDREKYDAFDIANEQVKGIEKEVWTCIDAHRNRFDSDQFCVAMLIAGDRMVPNLIRRKFYAWPFLPKPRPNQTVWLFSKQSNSVRLLWCLPHPDTVASLATLITVDPAYRNMQRWSRAFYTTKFWDAIRDEHNIKMLSEEEHLDVMRKEGAKSRGEDLSPLPTNPFDAARFNTEQVADA